MIVKTTVRRLAPLTVLPLFAALPVRAQLLPQPSVPTTAAPLSFEEIFAGVNPAPLTLKTSDLKGEWRLVTIKTRPEGEHSAPSPSFVSKDTLLREAFGAASGQFITQGQTVAGGGELFLVAYRMKFDMEEFSRKAQEVLAKQPQNAPFPATQMTAFVESYARERPLELALINVKTLSELSGVRAFNAEVQASAIRDLMQSIAAEEAAHTPPTASPTASAPKPPTATSASKPPAPTPAATPKPPATTTTKPPTPNVAALNAASQSNLKRLGGALLAYAKANNGLLPPMGTPAQAKAALTSLAGSVPIWVRADTGEAYRPNPMLSGRKMAHISNPDEFVAFYEVNTAPDGTRGVVFLDGTAKRLTSADWPRYKKASKLR
jgi:hypothetical protein